MNVAVAPIHGIDDVMALLGVGECSVLRQWYLRSLEVYGGYANGILACAWGVVAPSLLSDHAYLWLITSPLVDKNKFIFVRHSQIVIQDLLREYKSISGHTAASNESAVKWLKLLGAKFTESEAEGVLRFEIRRANG